MPTPTFPQYPEDLYGTLPSNLITDESHTVSNPVTPSATYVKFVVPTYAPFYADGLIVKDGSNNVLVLGTDYFLKHRFSAASRSTGKQIYGSILLVNQNYVGQIKVTYRTLGGPWVKANAAIVASLTRALYNIQTVYWEQIEPLPYAFPPTPHVEPIDDFTTWADVIAKLEQIRQVMITNYGNTSAFTNQLNAHVVAANAHNASQVGLGAVQNLPVATNPEIIAGTAVAYVTVPGLQHKVNSLGLKNGAVMEYVISNDPPATPTPNLFWYRPV